MKWNRILCLLIVSVLLTGGLTVLAGSEPAKGQNQPDSVTFSVNMDRENALLSLAEGETDIFMQSLDASIYVGMDQSVKDQLDFWQSSGGYNNYFFNSAYEGPNTTAMENALDEGYITSKDEVKYVLNNADGEWEFNPFAVQGVRYAMNHLVNRQEYIQDLYDGFGEARFIWNARSSGAYQDWFQDIIENGDPNPENDDGFGMSPSGNQQWAEDYIQQSLEEVVGEVSIGEIRSPSDSDTEFWQYKPPNGEWQDVEVNGAHRVEDARLDMGARFAEQLRNRAHIKVNEMERTRADLSPLVFAGNYDQGKWHYYTGGWLASGNVYYPHVALRQMYAPAYGFTLPQNVEGHWGYGMTEGGKKMNELTYGPFVGEVTSETDYWEQILASVKQATRESIRVFTLTNNNFYCYNKDSVNAAVPNAITGWDQIMGPRTLDTDKDHLTVEYYSSEGALYMDNWNWYGGSEGAYGANQRRWVLNYGSWNHPTSGRPMEILNNWTVERDYQYQEDGTLIKNMTMPDDAVEYNHHTGEWQTVANYYDEKPEIATKVTYKVNEGKWHHGSDYTIQDIMEWYARTKNIAYENNETKGDNPDYYYGPYASQIKPTYEKIHGLKFNPSEDTYTVWGSYTFPTDDMVGSYYSFSPRNAQTVYEAITQEVEDTSLSVHDQSFGWASGEGEVYVHLMSDSQGDLYIQTMENMKAEDWVPSYLRSENMPDAMSSELAATADEYATRIDQTIQFIQDHNNMFIANGPYYIADNIPETRTIEIEKFADYTTYYDWDYWPNQFISRGVSLANLQLPEDDVPKGENIQVSVEGFVDESFPEERTYAIDEDMDLDPFNMRVLQGGSEVMEITDISMDVQEGQTVFEASIPTDELEAGQLYDIEVNIGLADNVQDGQATGSVFVMEESTQPNIEVSNFEVDPTEGEPPLDVAITGTVENTGDESTTVTLEADGEEINSWDVGAGESIEVDEDYTFEDEGEYEVTLSGESASVSVQTQTDGGGIPGFTLGLLVLGAVIAVAIYQKKRQ